MYVQKKSKSKSKDKGTYIRLSHSLSKIKSMSTIGQSIHIASQHLKSYQYTHNGDSKKSSTLYEVSSSQCHQPIDDYGLFSKTTPTDTATHQENWRGVKKLKFKDLRPFQSTKHIDSYTRISIKKPLKNQQTPSGIEEIQTQRQNAGKGKSTETIREDWSVKSRTQLLDKSFTSIAKTLASETKQSSAESNLDISSNSSFNVDNKASQKSANKNQCKFKENLEVLSEIPDFKFAQFGNLCTKSRETVQRNFNHEQTNQDSTFPLKMNPFKAMQEQKMGSEDSVLTIKLDTSQKVLMYEDALNCLAEYSLELNTMYKDYKEWEELVFLVYKRFYIERLKLLEGLRETQPLIFKIDFVKFTNEELHQFQTSSLYSKIIQAMQDTNDNIKKQLASMYNNIDAKQEKAHINTRKDQMYSKLIWEEMWEEIQTLSQQMTEEAHHIQKRLCKVFQTAFLISQLDGNKVMGYLQGVDITDFSEYFVKGSILFQQHLLA